MHICASGSRILSDGKKMSLSGFLIPGGNFSNPIMNFNSCECCLAFLIVHSLENKSF